MRIMLIGDVVGRSGCDFLADNIYKIKKQYCVDITVVNGENSAAGNGITKSSLEILYSIGADVVTTGNHCFKRREFTPAFDCHETLLRPANYPEGVVGHGFTILDYGSCKVAVVNLQGVVDLEPLDNPFTVIDSIIPMLDTPNIFIDFHAEATAEKKALGQYLAGRVTGVVGTHTHVQTADETILSGHTAYITDIGMTGPELSVLGVESRCAIDKLRFHYPVRFEESHNPCFINAVVIDFDEKIGIAHKIERIIWR